MPCHGIFATLGPCAKIQRYMYVRMDTVHVENSSFLWLGNLGTAQGLQGLPPAHGPHVIQAPPP